MLNKIFIELMGFNPADGESINEAGRKWMQKEFPEVWNKYLWDVWDVLNEGRGFLLYQEALNAQLSLTNLARYLKEHEEWAWMECEYQNHCSEDPQAPDYCPTQKWSEGNCSGKIINPKFARVLEMLKEWNEK
jgi:hypothetical protein